MRPPLTASQRQTLGRVVTATLRGAWHRAGSSGERVTLASLWRRGLCDRRAWRGIEGEADAAHEYQAIAALVEAATCPALALVREKRDNNG